MDGLHIGSVIEAEVPMQRETVSQTERRTRSKTKPMQLAMMACCLVMAFPIAAFFLSGGSLSGASANIATFAPLLLCLGVHVVMHK